MSPRTRRLLHGPIIPTLLMLACNVLVMMARAPTGLMRPGGFRVSARMR